MDFDTAFALAQDQIYAHLGRRSRVWRQSGGDPIEVSAVVRTPTRVDQLQNSMLVQSGPFARIPAHQIDGLKKGDIIERLPTETSAGDAWQIAEAPRRPDPGRVWEASVTRAVIPGPPP